MVTGGDAPSKPIVGVVLMCDFSDTKAPNFIFIMRGRALWKPTTHLLREAVPSGRSLFVQMFTSRNVSQKTPAARSLDHEKLRICFVFNVRSYPPSTAGSTGENIFQRSPIAFWEI